MPDSEMARMSMHAEAFDDQAKGVVECSSSGTMTLIKGPRKQLAGASRPQSGI